MIMNFNVLIPRENELNILTIEKNTKMYYIEQTDFGYKITRGFFDCYIISFENGKMHGLISIKGKIDKQSRLIALKELNLNLFDNYNLALKRLNELERLEIDGTKI